MIPPLFIARSIFSTKPFLSSIIILLCSLQYSIFATLPSPKYRISVEYAPAYIAIQGDHLNMAVFFWYLGKSYLFSVCQYSRFTGKANFYKVSENTSMLNCSFCISLIVIREFTPWDCAIQVHTCTLCMISLIAGKSHQLKTPAGTRKKNIVWKAMHFFLNIKERLSRRSCYVKKKSNLVKTMNFMICEKIVIFGCFVWKLICHNYCHNSIF